MKASDMDEQDKYGNTALMLATKDNQIETLLKLLASGADPNIKNNANNSAIKIAVKYGHIELVEILLNNGASLLDIDSNYFLDLWFDAVEQGRLKLVKLLLDNGADASAINEKGETAIVIAFDSEYHDIVHILEDKINNDIKHIYLSKKWFLAIKESQVLVIKDMLENGMDPNTIDDDGRTSLGIASTIININMSTLLLENGADVNKKDKDGNTALIMAIMFKCQCHGIVELLLDNGADVSVKNNEDMSALSYVAIVIENWWFITPIIEFINTAALSIVKLSDLEGQNDQFLKLWFLASKFGSFDMVNFLIEKGIDADIINDDGNTALLIATKRNDHRIITLLINHGVDINKRNKENNNAIEIAIIYHNCLAVKCLLDNGAELNFNDNKLILNVCFLAIIIGDLPLVKLCLEKGVDPNAKNYKKESLLNCAVSQKKINIIETLLAHGANIDASESCNGRSLEIAIRYGDIEVIKLLLLYGADPNIKNRRGQHPLIYLVEEYYPVNKIPIIKLLLDYGADPNIKNKNNQTALMIASRSNMFGFFNQLKLSNSKPKDTLEEKINKNIIKSQKEYVIKHSDYRYTVFPTEIWLKIISDLDFASVTNMIYSSKYLSNICIKYANYKRFSFYNKKRFYNQFFGAKQNGNDEEEGPL